MQVKIKNFMHNQKINITQAYSLGHNSVLPNKITILTSHIFSSVTATMQTSLMNITEYFSQHPKGRKSSEIGFPTTKILEVTFPVKQVYGMSYILRPSNSLVTTSCRLDPFSSRGANPATKRDIVRYCNPTGLATKLKSFYKSIKTRDDLKSVPQTTPDKTHLRHVNISHTPPGF